MRQKDERRRGDVVIPCIMYPGRPTDLQHVLLLMKALLHVLLSILTIGCCNHNIGKDNSETTQGSNGERLINCKCLACLMMIVVELIYLSSLADIGFY